MSAFDQGGGPAHGCRRMRWLRTEIRTWWRAEEVPTVAGDVAEDDEPALGLSSGLGEEVDARGVHGLVASVEVIDAEEEADPTGVLVADRSSLVCTASSKPASRRVCA
jgi:hypothetical protein